MKEKVLEKLKTEYDNLGFSEKAFDGVADYLSKTVTEDTDLDNAVGGVGGLLKVFQGETDRERSKRSELEKKLKELESAKEGEVDAVDEVDDKDDEVSTKISQLEEMILRIQQENELLTKRKQLQEIAKAKDVPSGLLDYVNIPNDVDLEEFVGNLAQELVNSGLKSKKPIKGQGEPEKLDDSIASYINKKTEEKLKKN